MKKIPKTREEDSCGFISLQLKAGLLYKYNDGTFQTALFGFVPKKVLDLPAGYTHFGIVIDGEITLEHKNTKRILVKGDFFSVAGRARIKSAGSGMVNSAHRYNGFNVFGGPIEKEGRLRYIDGCTDTLLVPPVRKGDPCFNHLHFPKHITQTPHTHPSVRTGIIYKGSGECVTPDIDGKEKVVPLVVGHAFIIKTNAIHSFNTTKESMDVIAFHPDSDTGMTDEDHPMINRTMVKGISARYIEKIRTR